MHAVAFAALLGGVIAPFGLQSWWGLLLLPAGLMGAGAIGLMFPLRIVPEAQNAAAVHHAKWLTRVATCLLALVLLAGTARDFLGV